MAKSKSIFVCQNCGTESSKWMGKCNNCNEWNTFIEEKVQKTKNYSGQRDKVALATPKPINDIEATHFTRLNTKINELNRVLGGGLVPGSVLLVGGEPGIGKSTLALQLALLANEFKILYVSGEESNQQIKIRAERIGSLNPSCYILSETLLENIIQSINELSPDVIIIDSVQTLYSERVESSPGTVSQVRECAGELIKIAKTSSVPVILIGHINKEGNIAGPKVLEHMVDTVLHFEGDLHHMFRLLRVNKNRFGSTSEIAIFEMLEKGLREVSNPSEIFISNTNAQLSGVAIAATMDGNRPFLIETQALVSSAVYGTPQRSTTGFDIRRLNMLLAVLEKKARFQLASKDVFLNIAGGIKVADPAIDLGVIVAILSSSVDIPVNHDVCFAAEVGLTGEIRPVSRIEQRIREAEKLGFKRIFISKYSEKKLQKQPANIDIVYIKEIKDLYRELFK
jgi:DNA repair protein RadA/Sms